jgi:hypothetical protein
MEVYEYVVAEVGCQTPQQPDIVISVKAKHRIIDIRKLSKSLTKRCGIVLWGMVGYLSQSSELTVEIASVPLCSESSAPYEKSFA